MENEFYYSEKEDVIDITLYNDVCIDELKTTNSLKFKDRFDMIKYLMYCEIQERGQSIVVLDELSEYLESAINDVYSEDYQKEMTDFDLFNNKDVEININLKVK